MTVAAIIERANRHAAELVERGLGDRLAEVFRLEPGWLIQEGEPASEAEVAAVEAELGFGLPPSYRRFLLEHGSLTFFNHWCDETTAVGDLVAESRSLAEQVVMTHGRDPLVAAIADAPRVVRFADFHNHTAEYIYICNWRDPAGESPSFMWFHDDIFTDAGDLAHVESIANSPPPPPRPAGGVEPVTTDLTEAVDAILGGGDNQRARLAAIESELGAHLDDAGGAELLCALHAIRRGIKSKKLAAQRDELIDRWRDDGATGPLARLARPTLGEPAPAPKGFGTFAEWLDDRVDRQIEHIADRLG